MTFVSKRLASKQPQYRHDLCDHADITCVTLGGVGARELYIWNVYNNPGSYTASAWLISHSPTIDLMGGDFNLHHPMWDENYSGEVRPRDRDFQEWASTDQGLFLVNDPLDFTWSNPRHGLKRVLDLLWVSRRLADGLARPVVRQDTASTSDHFPVSVDIEMGWVVPPPRRLIIGEDDSSRYLGLLRDAFSSFPRDYERTPEGIERVGEYLRNRLHAAWDEVSRVPKVSRKSKTWWTSECSDVTAAMTRLRSGWLESRSEAAKREYEACKRRLKVVVRAAKRSHFDGVIVSTASNGRVWDLTGWTQPRPLCLTSAIVDAQGSAIESLDLLGDACAEQFHPVNPRPVDPQVLADVPSLPAREWVRFSVQELKDALSSTSNKSAPGPDQLTWQALKQVMHASQAWIPFATYF